MFSMYSKFTNGEMSEWSIVHAWKACVPKAPRVRIPVSPPGLMYGRQPPGLI